MKGGKQSPLSPTSPSPPTPSTATSVLTPRPSPPGFYPTPPYCSASTSYLPPSAPPTNLPGVPGNTHPSSFKFDTGSSRSNSVNQDSDISESNYPRYTYTFPQPGEGTPQIPRAYDQVDLPLDLEEQVSRPLPPVDSSGGPLPLLMCNGGLRGHHVSHGCIRGSEPRAARIGSASSSCKVAGGFINTESPHLRTQVCQHGPAPREEVQSIISWEGMDGGKRVRKSAGCINCVSKLASLSVMASHLLHVQMS